MLAQFLYRRRHYLREAFEKCDPSHCSLTLSFCSVHSFLQKFFFVCDHPSKEVIFLILTLPIPHRESRPHIAYTVEEGHGRGHAPHIVSLASFAAENYQVLLAPSLSPLPSPSLPFPLPPSLPLSLSLSLPLSLFLLVSIPISLFRSFSHLILSDVRKTAPFCMRGCLSH